MQDLASAFRWLNSSSLDPLDVVQLPKYQQPLVYCPQLLKVVVQADRQSIVVWIVVLSQLISIITFFLLNHNFFYD